MKQIKFCLNFDSNLLWIMFNTSKRRQKVFLIPIPWAEIFCITHSFYWQNFVWSCLPFLDDVYWICKPFLSSLTGVLRMSWSATSNWCYGAPCDMLKQLQKTERAEYVCVCFFFKFTSSFEIVRVQLLLYYQFYLLTIFFPR